MGRPAKGWILRWHGPDGIHKQPGPGRIAHVRFTAHGKQREPSTGERDPERAAARAREIYSEEIRRAPRRRAGRSGDSASATEAARWLKEQASVLGVRTRQAYLQSWSYPLSAVFPTPSHVTAASVEKFIEQRLKEVKRTSLLLDMSALRGLVRWLYGDAVADALPRVPDRAQGTPARKPKPPLGPISPDDMARIIAEIRDTETRAWFRVLYDTSLRPATVRQIDVPRHWRKGAESLFVTADIDKAFAERWLPLTAEAIAALTEMAPESGRIFPGAQKHSHALRSAAVRVLGERGRSITPRDFRRAALTHMAELTSNLAGIQHMAGHKRASTTARYVKPSERAAREVLGAIQEGRSGRAPKASKKSRSRG